MDGTAQVTTPATGQNSATTPDDPTIDAGLIRNQVSIGDTVWFDANRNGVQDTGEKPAPDVTVTLLDASGATVKTTTTNANGFYSFTALDGAAKYTVRFTAPTGYAFTQQTAGTDRTKDSNPGMDGTAQVTTPATGQNSATTPDDPTIDAGLIPAVGSLSWKKVDPNGQALGGSEWTLTPKPVGGAPVGPTLTITDCVAAAPTACTGPDTDPTAGRFALSGLAYGSYELRETRAPAGFVLLRDPIPVTVSSATTVLTDVVNTQQGVPTIPLTGGLGADGYRLAGGAFVLLMLGLGFGDRLRRRKLSSLR
ncbi:hypothetical protein GCM10009768_17880 [Leucobacter iarius]|uniref:SdrD B-like protein n=2 Tax=Leucobacter iarius TaxID=333963 RepID=A0ABP4XUU6_9MICO